MQSLGAEQTQAGGGQVHHGARTLAQWLAEYGESHTHPTNERLHWICIPLIILSLLGLLAQIPVPGAMAQTVPWLDWGVVLALGAVAYYFSLSRRLAVGSVLVLGALLAGARELAVLPWPVWLSSVAIFVIAWIGQFVGHAIEGRRPSFFKDLQFLLIGPLWLLAAAYRRVGLRY
jgi:uncharacterized membrane protein YGL010W